MTRVENSPAFLIHRRMYQGNSLLLDFFTKDHGKLRLVARGARSSKTSLQMFQCLSISYKGKGDLKSLSQWEISDEPRRLLGNDLVMAMYVNELIQRLLPEGDEHSEIFESYWSYIKSIGILDAIAKEYADNSIHVGHVIVDGGLAGDRIKNRVPDFNKRVQEGKLIDIESVTEAYMFLYNQNKNAWTFELDVRTSKENW